MTDPRTAIHRERDELLEKATRLEIELQKAARRIRDMEYEVARVSSANARLRQELEDIDRKLHPIDYLS